ncbi:hypothetical protein DEO45_15460 [Rhodanobacter denitrificans]|uniref:PLD phosphodiesterase domain-containing protein n=1 Tax=Rhodanobacter denitrificans TaxID=666685 RepID=A0A368KD56_9GAMM|nr:phospholipase D-like domain-containing protein [Rhodanobacter denitrificans]RCS28603.1 hypothetical protein DEO45_15460 [Rhodanobacter denitrificans]
MHGALGSTRDIARLIGVSHTRISDVISGLRAAEVAGAVRQDAHGVWRVTLPELESRELALLLRGAALYKEQIHEDKDSVHVVISKPAEPSRFVSALDSTLEGAWGLSSTADVLAGMAGRALTRFSIMTPFVDEAGASRILDLFAATRTTVRRELIVRNGLPEHLRLHEDVLRTLGIHVFDFRLSRLDRPDTETFHAKVVRTDDAECYVGSSNMTKWSFDYSLELGVLVSGSSGRRVSHVLDAVLAVSNEIPI